MKICNKPYRISMGHGASSSSIIHVEKCEENDVNSGRDYILSLPDECLACIFYSLSSGDRQRCSLVCKRWFLVEDSSRQRRCMVRYTVAIPDISDARSDITATIPSLFRRFNHVTKLVLRCDHKMINCLR